MCVVFAFFLFQSLVVGLNFSPTGLNVKSCNAIIWLWRGCLSSILGLKICRLISLRVLCRGTIRDSIHVVLHARNRLEPGERRERVTRNGLVD